MNPFEQPWFILSSETPGEHLILEGSRGELLAPIWLSLEEAERFARATPAAQGMSVERLETPALKGSFLRALSLLHVERILLGYQPGSLEVPSFRLEEGLRRLS